MVADGSVDEVSRFNLSEALPVMPARLMKRILKATYIDLLKDNLEAERHIAGQEGKSSQHSKRYSGWLSWLHCFSLYTAVVCQKYPQKSNELWPIRHSCFKSRGGAGGEAGCFTIMHFVSR